MELVRPDYARILDRLRRTLISVSHHVADAATRDELECADRVLALLEAEHDFLADHETDLRQLIKRVEESILPMADEPGLSVLLDVLARQPGPSLSERDLLREKRIALQDAVPLLAEAADRGEHAADEALALLIDMETSLVEAVHSRRRAAEARTDLVEGSGTSSANGASGGRAGLHALSNETLRDYLRATFSAETELEVASSYNVPGGRSKETTMVELAAQHALPSRIVFRSDIPGGLVPSRTVDEFRIIEIASRHGVPVPAPLHCETDASRLGVSFIIVSAVEGSTQGEYFPELGGRVQDKPGVGRQLARILARIHAIPVSELADTHIPTQVDLVEYVHRTIEDTYTQAREQDFPARIHLEMAYRWLTRNIRLADDVPCLIHCDVGLHNMLIDDENRITAMLDWELATLASPAREVSKILHLIDYLMPREDFFSEYLAAGGPPNALDPDRLNFYAIMNYMVTHQRARYANRLFYTGQIDSMVMANAGYDSFYRGWSLISNALKPVHPGAYGGAAARMLSGEAL